MKGRGASKGRGLLLLLLLGLLSGYSRVVLADWTGVMVTLEDDSTDWLFAGGNRQARSSRIRFMVEEKTASALRVGVDIGHLSLRVVDPATSLAEKYDAQSLGVYLRLPLALGEHFSLDSLFTYRYNNGSGNDNLAPLDIEWSEANLQIGIGVTVASFRITPFAAYASIDGDVSGSGGTRVFELAGQTIAGIRFDYFVEDSAFVRVEFVSGARSGGYLSFARQY